MRAFEKWGSLTHPFPGFFMPEAAATWNVLLDIQAR
jgi:hypothetical protein